MKLNQKGALDMMLVAALAVVLVAGGFVLFRISDTDEAGTNITETTETAEEEIVRCEGGGKVFREGSDIGESPSDASACDLPECRPGVAGGIGNAPCFSSNPDEVRYWD